MNLRGGRNAEIKRKLKDIRDYVLLRIWFPFIYQVGKWNSFDENKVILVESNGANLGVSFHPLVDKLYGNKKLKIKEIYLHKEENKKCKYFFRSTRLVFESASSKYIFLSDALNLYACISVRTESIYTQLWHGCGAFKRFGKAVPNVGKEKYSNYAYNTWLTISSPEVRWAYEEACGLPANKIISTGISRTDRFFDLKFRKDAYEHLERIVPRCSERKIILYAPTFRGDPSNAKSPKLLSWNLLQKQLQDNYIIIIKQHPHIKERLSIPEEYSDFVFDLSHKMEIDELMCVSELCITDYSSLIFEYSLFERPLIFYAYDLEQYYDEQGFFYEYDKLIPGPICRTEQEILEQILNSSHYDKTSIRNFKNKFMSSCDGQATQRILKLVFRESW